MQQVSWIKISRQKVHEQKLERNKFNEQNQFHGEKFNVQVSEREKNKMQQVPRTKISTQ